MMRPSPRGVASPAGWDDLRDPGILERTLAALREETGAAGVVLILASPESTRTVYDGLGGRRAEGWLRDAFAGFGLSGGVLPLASAAETLSLAPDAAGGTPLVLPLSERGLLAVWPGDTAGPSDRAGVLARAEAKARALEPLLEAEEKRRIHFDAGLADPELGAALRGGDEGGVSALLAMIRTASGADLAYWGTVHDGVVDVSWHQGARDEGFGFELPLGQGIGGRAFAGERIFEVPDYLNCQYRYPGVSDVTDSEDVRTTLAVPVRGADAQTGAVLYAVRREVTPFSDAERLLLGRLARGIGPLRDAKGPVVRPPGAASTAKASKDELRRMVLEPPGVAELEAWIERLVKGTSVLVDRSGRPYVPSRTDRFEELVASGREPTVTPLAHPRAPDGRGDLYLWPSVELPPEGWPDLLDDVAVAAAVALDRAERAYDQLNYARSRWLRDVSEGRTGPSARREGNRLGLPVDRGIVWTVAWRPQGTRGAEETRRMMLAGDAALDRLGSPLISGEDGVGVLLLKEETRERPAAVRDELLRFFGPAPLWLVHGAAYDSPEALKDALVRVVAAAKRARDEDSGWPVQELGGQGLDGLLENPKLSGELEGFAEGVLRPLLRHDVETGSSLTPTLCLALAEGREVAAERLFVHANTVRYRIRRAAQVLDADLDSPKQRTTLSLAALIHLRRHEEFSGNDAPGQDAP